MIGRAHLILYVADQSSAAGFWEQVLDRAPDLDTPGMTEFVLTSGAVLGLMPEAGIRDVLGPRLPDPVRAAGVPRAEVYLVLETTECVDAHHGRALAAGGRELSSRRRRDWGHEAAYSLDPDGHVVAFAVEQPPPE